ncbi:trafficking protein particle complex subunit 10-like isoform X2 [Mizuhopecten yessoensis]|uniref:Trafficking protein particle complex subunit 10 n=1 Tax=Mizuhopecten yessoensis TaxID=6573 RepID=A0A210QN96_MIZYE|nr:trafficking protein particle complex subunit 10-like isoform X2 [Mizuhopecten yessoensis]OWF50213.1 Trafficking protein particle complex subunit 10 [Mizuhopecten yessoensis]
METKPIVTSHGNQVLFSSLHSALLQGLPREPTEWRRSYGRPPKTLKLEASFVPFDEDILPQDKDKTLVSRPYFHIFWTDCDLDTYKQSVKEELLEWHTALKNKNNPDWLIAVVVNDESKIKSKLLPRSSVIDKVKNDFCSKQPDRCIVLNEPLKLDSKSQESWNGFLGRLRGLMLQAFSRHLSKYEENMRSLREKRNEPGWDFVNFFLVQEELGFMFEMLGLHDDALIQYDELDALFSQFVLTQATTGKKAAWMSKFMKDCTSWAGLSLRKAINLDKRDKVKHNEATLLDFRNYLFSRQCALLFLLEKPWEVAQRAVNFLHQTIQEVNTLKVVMPEAALDCWVFLSCMEILQTCEKHTDSSQMEAYSLYTANLRDYTRRKLYSIGEMCGLTPDNTPSSEQLTMVLDLTSGMGIEEDSEEDYSGPNVSHTPRPRDKLREALSSNDTFQKIFLELSELTMGTFKHIGRFRSARLIGKDLADFYLRLGEAQKAENFLVDAMKSYQREGWHALADGALLELAKCQKLQDTSFTLKLSSLFHIAEVTVLTPKVIVDQPLEVEVILVNNTPSDIQCDNLKTSLKKTNKLPKLLSQKTAVFRQASNSSAKEAVPNFNPVAQQITSILNVQAHYEGAPQRPNTAGIVCINTHEVLRRADSSGRGPKLTDTLKDYDDFTNYASCDDVVIKPGENKLIFVQKNTSAGHYKLGQLWVKMRGMNFIKYLEADQFFLVHHDEPSCEIIPVSGDKIVSGIQQWVELTIDPGSFILKEGDELTYLTSDGLTVCQEEEETTLRVSKITELGHAVFRILLFHDIYTVDRNAEVRLESDVFPDPVCCSVMFSCPFHVTHKLHTASNRKYLQILVHGNTREDFTLVTPNLTVQSPDVELLSLNKANQELVVNGNMNVSYMWQLKSNTKNVIQTNLCFTTTFHSILDQENKSRQLSYECNVENFMTLYTVKTIVSAQPEMGTCKVGAKATLRIHIRSHEQDDEDADTSLSYQVLQDSSIWALFGNTSGVVQLCEDMTAEITLGVVPLVSGLVPHPPVQLLKNQADVWFKQGDNSCNSKNDSDIPMSNPEKNLVTTRTLPFSHGQVYYSSIAQQVHVLPDAGDSN